MFTIDLYTSYTALLTVFTTIQRIFAQKYVSESLFMSISGKKTKNLKIPMGPTDWTIFKFDYEWGKTVSAFVKTDRYFSFTKIMRLDGRIGGHWTAADDISESDISGKFTGNEKNLRRRFNYYLWCLQNLNLSSYRENHPKYHH